MMVNTNVYGYVTDGATFHPACTTARPGPDRDDVAALFYLDDEDPHGMTCDACTEYIFEPVGQHTANPDGTCDYGCFSYCGDTESCWLHHGSEAVATVDPLASLWTAPAVGYPIEED